MKDIETRHPEITPERLDEWALMRAAADGEGAIKSARETYLPMPRGFRSMEDGGVAAYAAYLQRAQFPEIVAPSISAMVGVVHGREIQVEIPTGLAHLHEDADGMGLPLDAFHRRITRNLLTIGRFGVLADAPEGGGEPFLAGYYGPAIINWDRDFWVLDETHNRRNGFRWEGHPRFRVLQLEERRYTQTVYEGRGLEQAEPVMPTALGGGALGFVPFACANARDVAPGIEPPPLIGVARAALANYQLNADYRLQLYMSGQETLVAINGDAPDYVGAGVVHEMHGTDTAQPDLKYVSPTCAGITAHREAMQDNREAAVMAGARMLEQSEGINESGTARKLRFASESASLKSVAVTSCALLERSLKHAAMMKGLAPDDVVVTPPDDLMDRDLTPTEAAAIVSVWQNGGISYQTMYEFLQRGGIASMERDHDAESALIDDEQFREPGEGP